MQINHWDRLRIVSPSLRAAEGTGSRRLYSRDDLAQVEVARRLRELNVGLECLGRAVRQLRSMWPGLAAVSRKAVVLIRVDGSCDVLSADAQLANMLEDHRIGIVLDLAGLIGDLRTRLRVQTQEAAKKPTETAKAADRGARASSWGEDW